MYINIAYMRRKQVSIFHLFITSFSNFFVKILKYFKLLLRIDTLQYDTFLSFAHPNIIIETNTIMKEIFILYRKKETAHV